MTTLHQAIADNLILDPETGEWVQHCTIRIDPGAIPGGASVVWHYNDRGGIDIDSWTNHPKKEQTDHE